METLHDTGAILLHLAMGLGLAASAGLRAFLPMLIVGLAARLDLVELAGGFAWLESWPAITVFAVAVAAELGADKFPVVDHFLDMFQMIVKPVAGALLAASVTTDWTPLYLVVFSVIAGAASAGVVHVTKSKLRLASSLTTAGTANPVLSLGEDAVALTASVGAILVPAVVALVFLVAVAVVWYGVWRIRRRPRAA